MENVHVQVKDKVQDKVQSREYPMRHWRAMKNRDADDGERGKREGEIKMAATCKACPRFISSRRRTREDLIPKSEIRSARYVRWGTRHHAERLAIQRLLREASRDARARARAGISETPSGGNVAEKVAAGGFLCLWNTKFARRRDVPREESVKEETRWMGKKNK